MIRVMRQRNPKIRCTLIQVVLLIAMMLCLTFPQPRERVAKPVEPHAVPEGEQYTFTGYIADDARFL